MESFLYILAYSLLTFSVAYYCLSNERTSRRNFEEELAGMWRLTYGDFIYVDNYGLFEWMFFVFSTLIVPLVMMNLLIAIISDSFERVYNSKLSFDFQVKCSLILEAENLLFWRRNKPAYKFLHMVLKRHLVDKQNEEWEGRVQSTKRAVENVLVSKLNSIQEENRQMHTRLLKEFKELLDNHKKN